MLFLGYMSLCSIHICPPQPQIILSPSFLPTKFLQSQFKHHILKGAFPFTSEWEVSLLCSSQSLVGIIHVF